MKAYCISRLECYYNHELMCNSVLGCFCDTVNGLFTSLKLCNNVYPGQSCCFVAPLADELFRVHIIDPSDFRLYSFLIIEYVTFYE